MTYDPERRHRRSIRLKGYDYSQAGAYFVTLCTEGRACLFGEVFEDQVRLTDIGLVAEECWLEIPAHFPTVELDAFVIMPNHVHGILVITWDMPSAVGANVRANNHSPQSQSDSRNVGANNYSPLPVSDPPRVSEFRSPSRTIGSIIRGFKIGVTKWCRQNTAIMDVWQRNYYEHIIRDETSLVRIRQYIQLNPARWDADIDNPAATTPAARDEWTCTGE